MPLTLSNGFSLELWWSSRLEMFGKNPSKCIWDQILFLQNRKTFTVYHNSFKLSKIYHTLYYWGKYSSVLNRKEIFVSDQKPTFEHNMDLAQYKLVNSWLINQSIVQSANLSIFIARSKQTWEYLERQAYIMLFTNSFYTCNFVLYFSHLHKPIYFWMYKNNLYF